MKYSDFLKLIHSNITPKSYYLCHALEDTLKQYPQYSELGKKFKKYIKRLLHEELAERLKEDPSWDFASALHKLLHKRYGIDCNQLEARQMLIAELITYHEVRGN